VFAFPGFLQTETPGNFIESDKNVQVIGLELDDKETTADRDARRFH